MTCRSVLCLRIIYSQIRPFAVVMLPPGGIRRSQIFMFSYFTRFCILLHLDKSLHSKLHIIAPVRRGDLVLAWFISTRGYLKKLSFLTNYRNSVILIEFWDLVHFLVIPMLLIRIIENNKIDDYFRVD